MGFVRQKKTYLLKWADDPDMEGLEVSARAVPLGTLLEVTRLADSIGNRVTSEEMSAIDQMFRSFARALVSWNLEDEGEDGDTTTPVPATLEGVLSQDLDFMVSIVLAWIKAHIGVADELGKGSPSGVTYPEGSLPMEPLSHDLESLTTP